MLKGLHVLIWMCYKKRRLTIIGMSIQAFVRFLEMIHKIHSNGREASKSIQLFRETRPDSVFPKVWTKIVKVAQNREQEWAKEEQKLDNGRKL